MNLCNWQKYQHNLVLNLDEDHLFKIAVDEHFDRIVNDYNQVLSEKELDKAKKYNKESDGRRYIVSKYYLRKILSSFIKTDAPAINFKETSNKKPSLPGIEFNVTHSGNFVLIVVSKSQIGVDLELINKSFDFKPLLANCFHPDEAAYLKSSSKETADFYRLWTRKEALLKATGEGLIDELDQLNCLDNHLTRNNLVYYLSSFLIENDYVMSLAKLENGHLNFWEY